MVNSWVPDTGLSILNKTPMGKHQRNADHLKNEGNFSSQVSQTSTIAYEEEIMVLETQVEGINRGHNEVPQE